MEIFTATSSLFSLFKVEHFKEYVNIILDYFLIYKNKALQILITREDLLKFD